MLLCILLAHLSIASIQITFIKIKYKKSTLLSGSDLVYDIYRKNWTT